MRTAVSVGGRRRSCILLHTASNGRYGFHRDELASLDDGRNLAWGYVAYPPLTPFLARIAFTLFGPSLIALRFSATLALSVFVIRVFWFFVITSAARKLHCL